MLVTFKVEGEGIKYIILPVGASLATALKILGIDEAKVSLVSLN